MDGTIFLSSWLDSKPQTCFYVLISIHPRNRFIYGVTQRCKAPKAVMVHLSSNSASHGHVVVCVKQGCHEEGSRPVIATLSTLHQPRMNSTTATCPSPSATKTMKGYFSRLRVMAPTLSPLPAWSGVFPSALLRPDLHQFLDDLKISTSLLNNIPQLPHWSSALLRKG